MPYNPLPDRRMPWDNDGSAGYGQTQEANSAALVLAMGPDSPVSQALMQEMNDAVYATLTGNPNWATGNTNQYVGFWIFFPEQREVTGINALNSSASASNLTVQGSADSTNGSDGTWETASLSGSSGTSIYSLDGWRANIAAVSFTGPKKAIRYAQGPSGTLWGVHVYGEKGAGQTPDDLIYINHDDTPGVEYTAAEDFGDQPLGTTVVRQFRLKNTSPSKTANTINIQCNDADFAISADGTTWVVTINLTSLAAGAESATMYVRSTTPALGSTVGPRFARIVTTVGSYT